MGKDESKGRFIIEPHSPYYLHPSDGPGALIMAVVFNGKNYDLWEKAIHTSLKAKNKLGFIDRTLKKPKPNENEEFWGYHAWDIANSMICSWIINIIEPQLHPSIAYADSAYTMWNDLRKRYAVANAPRIYQLKRRSRCGGFL